jgi:hypothetical protein
MVTVFAKMDDDGIMNVTNQWVAFSICRIGRGNIRDQESILSKAIDEILKFVFETASRSGDDPSVSAWWFDELTMISHGTQTEHKDEP